MNTIEVRVHAPEDANPLAPLSTTANQNRPAIAAIPTDSDPCYFNKLNQDCVTRICQFLTAPEVVKLGSTSQRLASITTSKDLWTDLFLQDFDINSNELPWLQLDPRLQYVRRAAQHATRVKTATEARRIHRVTEQRGFQQQRWHIMLTLFEGSWLILPAITLLALTALVAQKLDGTLTDSWWVIFTPVWIFIGLTSLCCCSAGCVGCFRLRHVPVGHPFRGAMEYFRKSPAYFFFDQLIGVGRDRIHTSIYCIMIAITLTLIPIMFVAKIAEHPDDNGPNWSWGTVLIPLWLAFLYIPCLWCFRCGDHNSDAAAFASFASTINCLFIVPVVIMLVVNFSGKASIPLQHVLIPIWILHSIWACAFIGAVLTGIIGCCCFGEGQVCLFASIGSLGLAIIFGLPLITTVLTTVKIAGALDITWMGVFAPMLAWFSLVVLVLCVPALAVCGHPIYEYIQRVRSRRASTLITTVIGRPDREPPRFNRFWQNW